MKVIKLLKDNIQILINTQIDLLKERDLLNARLHEIRNQVDLYQDEIDEMQLAIEKLEKSE